MDSTVRSPGTQRLMPFRAILRDEFRGLFGSWLVRLWLAATGVLTLLSWPPNGQNFPRLR